jgi:sugar/nucleoside kinase (ribokinase family)
MDRFSPTRFDYVAVGHVTCDVLEHSTHGTVVQPGGGAFYSALQAARLGLRTLILTQGAPEEIEALLAPYLDELELHVFAAPQTTTLSTRGTGTQRTQRMLAWAGAIVDQIELDTAILHLASVARETPTAWSGAADFVGITPQGLVRHWAPLEGVPLVQLDTGSLLGDTSLVLPDGDSAAERISAVDLDPALLPERFDAAVISEHECPNCHELFPAARRHGACVAVTAGSRPTTVHMPAARSGGNDSSESEHYGEENHQVAQTSIPSASAVRDDLGAGDVFAAAFFIALAQGRAPLEAATYGNAAAAVRIAGMGPGAVGDHAQIEATLGTGESTRPSWR